MMADVAPRSRWKVRVLGALLVVLVVGGSAAYLGWRQAAPPVRAVVIPPPRFIGLSTTFTVVLEAARGRIAQAEVRIAQGGGGAVVLTQPTPAGSRLETPVTIQGATLGLREGAATLEVWARDDYWRPLRRTDAPAASIPVTIDLTPPSIDVLAATQYVSQGGGGIVVFRLRGGDAAEVRAGTLAFPSFPAGDGGARVALIGLPWDFRPGTPLTVAAHDEAGNAATRLCHARYSPSQRSPAWCWSSNATSSRSVAAIGSLVASHTGYAAAAITPRYIFACPPRAVHTMPPVTATSMRTGISNLWINFKFE